MKKITLTLILIFSLTFGTKAQNNWKFITSKEIIASVVSDKYTWILHKQLLVQVNNITQVAKEFRLPIEMDGYNTMQAVNESLIIVINTKIFHFENGIWTELYSNVDLFAQHSAVNKSTNQIVLIDGLYDKIFLIKDKSIKTFNFSGKYELGTLVSIRNSNSIFFTDSKTGPSKLVEIDSNGTTKSYLVKNKIGTEISSIESMNFIQNKLFFYSNKLGLNSVDYSTLDTAVQNIIPLNKLKSIEYRSFDFDKNNNLILFSWANATKNIYYLSNFSGSILDSAKSPVDFGGLLNYCGVTNSNKLLFIYISNKIYKIDQFDLTNFYEYKHAYEGDEINYSDKNTFISGNRMYELKNEIVINEALDSIQNQNLNLAVVKIINNKKYLIGNYNGKVKLSTKTVNEYQKIVAEIPIWSPSEVKDLIVDAQEQVYLLTSTNILVYKSDKTWDTLVCKASNNISSLNSFCIDKRGTIWIATNKGIASIINNEIALEGKLNIRFNTINIIYAPTNDYLIFNLINSVEERLYIHDLTTNQSQTFKTINYIDKMVVNNKAELFTLRRGYSLNKFDLNIMNWDSTFNNNIIGTAFENRIYQFSIDENNFIYLFKREGILNSTIYIYNEDGFLSSIENQNNRINLNISLYPNPFTDVLNIETKELLNTYSIINTEGKEIQKGTIINNKVPTNCLPSGTYFIRFTNHKGSISKKIIKF
jgi:hypothetical protein